MLIRSRLIRWGLWIGLICVLLATIIWGIFQPWAANHFGYALPGQDRLPNRITYAGRYYGNPNECAGDDWCQPADKSCMSQRELIDENLWPLKQIGSIPTLFGPAYPIFQPPGENQMYLLVHDNDDCYLTYSLMGGP